MSIRIIDNDIYDIYIMNNLNIDFNDEDKVEVYLKELFDRYNIELMGFYNVDIYIDKYYGVVIHVEKEELDYYNYYKNQVDMKITINRSDFLYEVDNIIEFLLDKTKIHIIDNNMYLEIISDIDIKDMMYLIEYSNNILYNYSK